MNPEDYNENETLNNDSSISFKDGNPGAVRYGNFINYYQFHSPQSRLHLLPSEIFSKCVGQVHALDIGCNAGDLTLLLYSFLQENVSKHCKMLGVDLDPILINRAQLQNSSKDIKFKCLDIMTESGKNNLKSYLDINKLAKFSVIFIFSVTMWIHLNHGDEGFRKFISDIFNLGSIIVIEPQPWKCYLSAARRLKKSGEYFPFLNQLKIKDIQNEIQNIVNELFCGKVTQIYISEESDWSRRILIYKWVA